MIPWYHRWGHEGGRGLVGTLQRDALGFTECFDTLRPSLLSSSLSALRGSLRAVHIARTAKPTAQRIKTTLPLRLEGESNDFCKPSRFEGGGTFVYMRLGTLVYILHSILFYYIVLFHFIQKYICIHTYVNKFLICSSSCCSLSTCARLAGSPSSKDSP